MKRACRVTISRNGDKECENIFTVFTETAEKDEKCSLKFSDNGENPVVSVVNHVLSTICDGYDNIVVVVDTDDDRLAVEESRILEAYGKKVYLSVEEKI